MGYRTSALIRTNQDISWLLIDVDACICSIDRAEPDWIDQSTTYLLRNHLPLSYTPPQQQPSL